MKRIGAIAALVGLFVCVSRGNAQPASFKLDPLGLPTPVASVPGADASIAYPEGDFQRQLAAATGDLPTANEHPWGAGGSPFRTGPGLDDTYRVGRKWRSQYEGLVLFRSSTDLDALIGAATAGGVAIPVDPTTLTSDFEHGGGVRLLLTSAWPNQKGYELQVGYEGIFEWNAGAFNPDVPPAGPIVAGAPITQRSLAYRSSLHSIETNVLRSSNHAWQPFAGVRYLRLAENVRDLADQTGAPVPTIPTTPATFTDIERLSSTNNNLIGFQIGGRSELNPLGGRFTVSSFGSAGVYCNLLRRDSLLNQTNTVVTVDDPATPDILEGGVSSTSSSSGFESQAERIAFVGELGVSGVYQINTNLKARFGYQVLVIDGIETAENLFLGAGNTSDTLVLHGWFAGIERRR